MKDRETRTARLSDVSELGSVDERRPLIAIDREPYLVGSAGFPESTTTQAEAGAAGGLASADPGDAGNDRPQRHDLPYSERLVSVAVPVALVAVFVIFSVLKPQTFFTVDNLETVLTGQATLFAVALCLTVVLASGGLDLSIGGTIGFSGVIFAYLAVNAGLAWWLAVVISFGFAVLIGLLNAALIVRVRVNSLIVTLAMGTLLDGVSSAVSRSQTIGNLPASLQSVVNDRFLGIGAAFWYGVVIAAVLWYVLHHMRSGRRVYFTGEGREAARLVGIRVDKVRTVALVVSAAGACLGGLIQVGQTGSAQSGVGDPFILPAFAACFLGASTVKVGRFNPIGTFLAVALLAVGSDGLQLFGLDAWVTQVYDAGILILAVGFVALASRGNSTAEHGA